MNKISLTLLLTFLCISNLFANTNGLKLHIDEFGSSQSKSIMRGFIFFNGKYIDAPYIIYRKGLAVYINEVMIIDPIDWPIKDYDLEDPSLPDSINENSTFKDLDIPERPGDSYDRMKMRYLKRKYFIEEANRRIVDYYKSLPFVKSTSIKHNNKLIVETNYGEFVRIDLNLPAFYPPTKNEIISELERKKDRFEKRLEMGDCFFLFDNRRELSFGISKVYKDMKIIAEILRSNKSDKEKINLLLRLNILPPHNLKEPVIYMVTRFEASSQLEKRIDILLKENDISPTTYDDIPEEIPGLKERRLMDEAFKKMMEEKKMRESSVEK